MDNTCQLVVFSDKAYNAIIRETFEWDPVETGGILLGHILDNGCWIVMEVLPPGYSEGREGDNVSHRYGFFEYNRRFVNYLANSVAEQYDIPLELLGLWHRHPGGMDHFSETDDGTNSTFATQNPHGVISGLINIDPQLRMTMYYLPHSESANRYAGRPNYQKVEIEVGSDLIPEEYFKLRYYQGEENQLHPYAPQNKRSQHQPSYFTVDPTNQEDRDLHTDEVESEHTPPNRAVNNHNHREDANSTRQETIYPRQQEPLSAISKLTQSLKKNRTWVIFATSMVIFLLSIFSIKNDFVKAFHFFADDKDVPVVIEIPLSDEEGDDLDDEKGDATSVVKPEDDKEDVDNDVTSTDSTKPASDQGVNEKIR